MAIRGLPHNRAGRIFVFVFMGTIFGLFAIVGALIGYNQLAWWWSVGRHVSKIAIEARNGNVEAGLAGLCPGDAPVRIVFSNGSDRTVTRLTYELYGHLPGIEGSIINNYATTTIRPTIAPGASHAECHRPEYFKSQAQNLDRDRATYAVKIVGAELQ